jgi:voltage-gated potassium channel Kch
LIFRGLIMADGVEDGKPRGGEYSGVYEHGVIRLSGRVDWQDGTRVLVRAAEPVDSPAAGEFGRVIIAGFGLPGRWVADIFDRHHIEYVIIEKNPETVEVQRKLGRKVVEGDVADAETLRQAGIEEASVLALTVPDEEAVLQATRLARAMRPGIYIVARTTYSSAGLRATQMGADDVVKAEQAVARQFYEMMLRRVGRHNSAPAGPR